MGCCPPGSECCMDCSNSTANGGPVWGCSTNGTCECYPSSNQCIPNINVFNNVGVDNTCCPTDRQCGATCCAADELCCNNECYKQSDTNYACCEAVSNVYPYELIGNTCPKSRSTCCTQSISMHNVGVTM